MADVCVRSDMPPEWCGCPDHRGGKPEPVMKHPAGPPPVGEDGYGPTTTARHRGWCPDCRGTIRPGEDIHYDEAGGVWVHVDCP